MISIAYSLGRRFSKPKIAYNATLKEGYEKSRSIEAISQAKTQNEKDMVDAVQKSDLPQEKKDELFTKLHRAFQLDSNLRGYEYAMDNGKGTTLGGEKSPYNVKDYSDYKGNVDVTTMTEKYSQAVSVSYDHFYKAGGEWESKFKPKLNLPMEEKPEAPKFD